MFKFETLDYNKLDSNYLSKYKNSDIYITPEWLTFLKKAVNVEPLVVEIKKEDRTIGFFAGAMFKKFGIKIIGSPFKGWNTPYMGFALDEGVSRIEILPELWKYLNKKYKCQYMEVCDRNIDKQSIEMTKLKYITESTYVMDISKPEEELLASFTKHCRKQMRVFINRGATVKQVAYDEEFLDRFYTMLIGVFKVQGLEPPYTKERLKMLLDSMKQEDVLCVETYNPEGKCIGSAISLGFNESCYAFASATDRTEDYKQKNYLRWYVIKYWKERGKKMYDLMGIRAYKLEFNPEVMEYYRIVFSKWAILLTFRNMAKKAYWTLNKIKFLLKRGNKRDAKN